MLIPVDGPFALAPTLESGQAFRWRTSGDVFEGVVFGNVVKVRQADDGVEFTCGPDDEKYLAPLLSDYLGLATDLPAVYRSMSHDPRVSEAIDRYRGMRILRQDPWECLVCFICSSASNIPRITSNVESICDSFGARIAGADTSRRNFPTPRQLAGAGERRLRDLRLGYRAEYLAATARSIADGKPDLFALREAPYEEALEALTALAGVGDKVANCVLLFSLDKPEAFPVDVWVHRALQEWYLAGRGERMSRPKMRLWAQEYFGEYAGYANEYLFPDRRLLGRGSTTGT